MNPIRAFFIVIFLISSLTFADVEKRLRVRKLGKVGKAIPDPQTSSGEPNSGSKSSKSGSSSSDSSSSDSSSSDESDDSDDPRGLTDPPSASANPRVLTDPPSASVKPSTSPTFQPSNSPSKQPTSSPSDEPSFSPSKQPTSSPSDEPSFSPSKQPTTAPSDEPSFSPSKQPTTSPSDKPSLSPSKQPTTSPSDKPSLSPSSFPSIRPLVPRPSLQEEIIKDMMPPSSGKCSSHTTNTTYAFESSQAESQWNPDFAGYEEDLFLAKMQHIDNNVNRSWTIRFGQAGNIYSMVGPMGETVPPQDHTNAPWVDEVWQAVQPLGNNGDNDGDPSTDKYFIHEAGVYQRDAPYTDKPFYSPTLGSYCNDEDGECGFVSWGQQAHVATPWKSPLLYLNRYVNCGNGVFEYTTLRHNMVGSADNDLRYLNVPWGGTRRSVLADMVITDKATEEQQVIYPLSGWSDGVAKALKDTMGYTIFAEDLPKTSNPLHDQPYTLPTDVDLTIAGSCSLSNGRYICPLVSQPHNPDPRAGTPGLIVRLQGAGGESIVAGINHWAWNSRMYFYDSDVLTLSRVRDVLAPGTTLSVFHYYPDIGKPEEDNLALAHVHGGSNGSGNYPRVRYGAAGRDFNVYTINDLPSLTIGSTYYYRQYFMMDAYTEMRSKGAYWAPEATKALKGVGTIAGRTVKLYKSDSGDSFGHAVGADNCRPAGAMEVCEGSTTPQAGWKALFEIYCGDSYAVTHDLYYFTPAGPPYRSYVCAGLEGTRPVWTLLGYFPEDSCSDIATAYQYNPEYC